MANPNPAYPGVINTCYLTTRLPHWAGVAQNVPGSDLTGARYPETNARDMSVRQQMLADLSLTLGQMRMDLQSLDARLRTLEAALPLPGALARGLPL